MPIAPNLHTVPAAFAARCVVRLKSRRNRLEAMHKLCRSSCDAASTIGRQVLARQAGVGSHHGTVSTRCEQRHQAALRLNRLHAARAAPMLPRRPHARRIVELCLALSVIFAGAENRGSRPKDTSTRSKDKITRREESFGTLPDP